MNPEGMQILEMLAAGKINPQDAEQLLDKISGHTKPSQPAPPKAVASVIHLGAVAGEPGTLVDIPPTPPAPQKPLRFLCVKIRSHKNDVVNIRIPIDLVRTGLKLSTMIPEEARERMSEHGVDIGALSGLQGEELIEALRELQVNVDSGNGDVVRIYCE